MSCLMPPGALFQVAGFWLGLLFQALPSSCDVQANLPTDSTLRDPDLAVTVRLRPRADSGHVNQGGRTNLLQLVVILALPPGMTVL